MGCWGQGGAAWGLRGGCTPSIALPHLWVWGFGLPGALGLSPLPWGCGVPAGGPGVQGPRGTMWPRTGGTGPVYSLGAGVHGVEGCAWGSP